MRFLVSLLLCLLLSSCFKVFEEESVGSTHWHHENKILVDKYGNLYKVKKSLKGWETYEFEIIYSKSLKEIDSLIIK